MKIFKKKSVSTSVFHYQTTRIHETHMTREVEVVGSHFKFEILVEMHR